MKILAFCDIHEDYGSVEVLSRKALGADFLLCAGDISVFGNGIEEAIQMLDSLGKKVFIVHGNHESEHKLKKLCENSKNVIFIHRTYYVFEDIMIMGYGGGGFSKEDDDFDHFADKMSLIIADYSKSILLTHAPSYGTKLDLLDQHHVGSKSVRRFIDKASPTVSVSGHIHETFKTIDKINATVLVNPGPDGAIIIL